MKIPFYKHCNSRGIQCTQSPVKDAALKIKRLRKKLLFRFQPYKDYSLPVICSHFWVTHRIVRCHIMDSEMFFSLILERGIKEWIPFPPSWNYQQVLRQMASWGEVSKINPHVCGKQKAWKTFNVKNRQRLPLSLINDSFDISVLILNGKTQYTKVYFSDPCMMMLECIPKTPTL